MKVKEARHLIRSAHSGFELDATLLRVFGHERASALLVHGITTEKNEGGMYSRLASDLEGVGISSLRFSFSGHGDSSGSDVGVSLDTQTKELESVIQKARSVFESKPLFVIASSFGAVSVLTMTSILWKHINGLVLWNPVLSVNDTFFEPSLAWGKQYFGASRISRLASDDYISVDGFKLSKQFFKSLEPIRNRRLSLNEKSKTLVVHGTNDTYVSFRIAKEMCSDSGSCKFCEIHGSDHGFDGEDNEKKARDCTVEWIVHQCKILEM
jgi:pimeloyl-ACP methyl ester carboxylesterase